jgi:hypothetical protein
MGNGQPGGERRERIFVSYLIEPGGQHACTSNSSTPATLGTGNAKPSNIASESPSSTTYNLQSATPACLVPQYRVPRRVLGPQWCPAILRSNDLVITIVMSGTEGISRPIADVKTLRCCVLLCAPPHSTPCMPCAGCCVCSRACAPSKCTYALAPQRGANAPPPTALLHCLAKKVPLPPCIAVLPCAHVVRVPVRPRSIPRVRGHEAIGACQCRKIRKSGDMELLAAFFHRSAPQAARLQRKAALLAALAGTLVLLPLMLPCWTLNTRKCRVRKRMSLNKMSSSTPSKVLW